MTGPGDVGLERCRQRIEGAAPGLLDQLAACRAQLAAHVGPAEQAMRALGPLTTRFCDAFYGTHPAGPDSSQAEGDFDGAERAAGVWAAWLLADRLRDAHPDG